MAKKQKRSEDQPMIREIEVDLIEVKVKNDEPQIKGTRTITNTRG